MAEPGNIIKTDGMVPLRFVVLAEGLELDDTDCDMSLYCTARDGQFLVKEERFMELENATIIQMTKQQIQEQINHEAAKIATAARRHYLDDGDGAEVL